LSARQVCLQYNRKFLCSLAAGSGIAPAAAGPLPLLKRKHITATCMHRGRPPLHSARQFPLCSGFKRTFIL
jgi:hypothetical protein